MKKGKSLSESCENFKIKKQDSDAKEKKPNMMKRKSHSESSDEKKKKSKKKKQDSDEKEKKPNMMHSESYDEKKKNKKKQDSDEKKEKKPNLMKRKSHSESYDEKKSKKKKQDSDAKKEKPNMMKRKSTSESYDEKKMKKPLILDEEPEEITSTKMFIGESSRSSCGICFDLKTDSDMFKRKSCNHLFCVDCIFKYLDSQISNNVVKVTCPTPNCFAKLLPRHLQHILPKEFIDRWELAKYESKITLEQKTYCAFKDCSVLLVNDNDEGVVLTSCECPSCHRLFCAQCKVPWHAEMNCHEFQRDKNEIDLDDKFLALAKRKKWQRCPNCSIYVKRSRGCEHIKCRCKCNFCYLCGKKWKHGHLC